MTFVYFSYLIALARISSTMLNKCGRHGHSYLALDLRRKAFSFLPFSMILAVCMSYMAFIILLSAPNLFKGFIMKGCYILTNAFSASIEMTI